jgi:hypothetical protein
MVDNQRIETALNKGEDAFWAAVADQFPEITTGDLSPDAAFALTRAMESAILAWVEANSAYEDVV